MDRKSIIALTLGFLVLLLYPYVIRWMYPPAQKPIGAQAEAPALEEAPAEMMQGAIQGRRPAGEIAPEELRPRYSGQEEEFVVENPQMRVVLTSWEGAIKEIGLKFFQDKKGGMIRLGALSGEGWKALQLLKMPVGMASGAYEGEIRGRKVVFRSTGDNPLSVRKTFTFEEGGYRVQAALELENTSDQPLYFEEGLGVGIGSIYPNEVKEGLQDVGLAGLDALGNIWRKKAAKVKDSAKQAGNYKWAGLQNQYYAMILKPEDETQGILYGPRREDGSQVKGCEGALWLSRFSLRPGGTLKRRFLLYSGPKEYFALKEKPEQFQEIIDFGFFSPISKGILYLLHYAYQPFRNYGIAIIILTLIVKVLTYPLSAKSLQSMKRMQGLQPHINELKKKHKDNPQKMQKEMMGLYKEHKVNPMGGCLPMLVQLPIFVALFTTLRSAIQLKGAGFLWINDLSLPDTVGAVAGLPINILPLIMGGTMIWQQKMSTVDPQQAKMMMLMPVFFTFIFYSFPSGLVLYWLLNNILSIAQQYQVQRQKS